MVHLEYFTFKLQLQCSLPIAAIDVPRELWWVWERKQIDKLNAMVIEKKKKKDWEFILDRGQVFYIILWSFSQVSEFAHAVLLKFITRCQIFNFVAEWGLMSFTIFYTLYSQQSCKFIYQQCIIVYITRGVV